MRSRILLYTIGIPGAGKTTFAHHVSGAFGMQHLEGDAIASELFLVPKFDAHERQIIDREMAYRTEDAVSTGRSVLFDSRASTRAARQKILALAQKLHIKAIGVWVEVPLEVAMARATDPRIQIAAKLKRQMTQGQFMGYVEEFEPPEASELCVKISGEEPFAKQRAALYASCPNWDCTQSGVH